MMKDVYLAIFINEYDKKVIKRDLMKFDNVNELDYFMSLFGNDNEEVRRFFEEEISEYFIDNINFIKKIEDKTKKKFRGRLAAYHYDNVGNLEFISLSTPKKSIVRDYRHIMDVKKCMELFDKTFELVLERLKKQEQKTRYQASKGDFVHIMVEAFRKYNYEFSEDEIYYLVVYYNNPNEKNKKACLMLMKRNVEKIYAELKEIKKKKEEKEKKKKIVEESDKEEIAEEELDERLKELVAYNGASLKLQYDLEMVKKTGDFDYLFLNHDSEEIRKYTNYYQIYYQRGGK